MSSKARSTSNKKPGSNKLTIMMFSVLASLPFTRVMVTQGQFVPSTAPGVRGGPAVAGGPISGLTVQITDLSRQAGSAAGGTSVGITGLGFQPGATVLFGGVPAVSVVVSSLTEIGVATPPHAPAVVDVTAINLDGSTATLLQAFSYEPTPTVTYFNVDFEDGTLGPFEVDRFGAGQVPVVSADFAHTGIASVRCVITNTDDSASSIEFAWGEARPPFNSGDFPLNPALSNVNGLYQRWYVLLPQSTLTNVNNTAGPCALGGVPPCGQIKLLLNRYEAESGNNWFTGGIGPEFGPFVDLLPGTEAGPNTWVTTDDGVGDTLDWSTAVTLQANTWYEIETFYKRDASTSTGRAKMWINGKLVTDTGPLPGLGMNDPGLQQTLFIGAAYGQNQAGPLTVYVDDAAAADGFIEPPR